MIGVVRTIGVIALGLVALVPAALGGRDAPAQTPGKPLLGVTGDPQRFAAQTGQRSRVRHTFIGWSQGVTWGKKLERFLPEIGPIPMLHLGTGKIGREVITPLQIARGDGDAELVALNRIFAGYGGPIYLRLLAEMNNPKNFWSYERTPNAAHSSSAYRGAFCRVFTILHGGDRVTVNARLSKLRLPPLRGTESLASNPKSKLKIVWSPVVGQGRYEKYYPGGGCTDLVGNAIFTHASMALMQRFYDSYPGKRFVIDWGLDSRDEPNFVKDMCAFVRKNRRVEVVAYYEAKAGSRYDLGNKPAGRAAYRRCMTPLG